MPTIQSLPLDVQSLIWFHLSLGDILRLRQTCLSLSTAISNDKQLWARFLVEVVESQSHNIPLNILGVEKAEARAIESWVKHATLLSRSYSKADKKLVVHKVQGHSDLRVTWLKLVLGRWCLISSSNDEKSELSLWEIKPQYEVELCARIFLEAPVVDGQLDDSSGRVRCAITIGASVPYILILGICCHQRNVEFHQLAKVPQASVVRFLHGNIVGFAVHHGDDTYPYIVNWETGSLFKLCVPGDISQLSPIPFESCVAMTIKNGYVFTLHRSAIHVFSVPAHSDDFETVVQHVARLELSEMALEGQFIDDAFHEHSIRNNAPIRLYFQNFDSEIIQVNVLREDRLDNLPRFSVVETLENNPPDVPGARVLYRYCIGRSARRIFCLTSRYNCSWIPASLFTAGIRAPTYTEEGQYETAIDDYVLVSREGFPLLQMITAIDFDDGHGLLLIGTESGDVRLISFLETQVIAQGSMENDLPEDFSEIRSTRGITRVSQTAVRSNLPMFYDIRKHYTIWDNLPTEVFEQITRDWTGQYAVPLSFAGWSNDWTRFQRVWDWIRPFSRWGSLDVDYAFYNTSCSIARMRLQTLGNIIPVAYCIKDHFRVIFRTGERMFYCRTLDRTVDRESIMDIDYEDEDDIVLGILPLTYREFISDPLSIIPHVSDYDTHRNLTDWFPPYSHSAQSRIAGTVRTIRKYQKETSGKILDDASMESWTDGEWDENYRATDERLQNKRKNIPEFVEGPAYFVPV